MVPFELEAYPASSGPITKFRSIDWSRTAEQWFNLDKAAALLNVSAKSLDFRLGKWGLEPGYYQMIGGGPKSYSISIRSFALWPRE